MVFGRKNGLGIGRRRWPDGGADFAPAKVYGWWNGPSFVLRRACQIPSVNMYSDNRRDLMSGLKIDVFLRSRVIVHDVVVLFWFLCLGRFQVL